jgi:CheY-like chemotaxis protein/predicted regulator of Ras-like GTPase activity (Roadblock/LC7/MglB family)
MQPKTILIVDDEASLLFSLKEGLKTYSDRFHLLTAANGKEAVALLEAHSVDLLITDLKMPEMDGFELLVHLKAHYPATPSLVMTAFNTPELEARLGEMSSLKVIEKPIDFDELIETITQVMKMRDTVGGITGITLSSFLQLVEMEGKTCLLEIRGEQDQHGLLYFTNGQLINAAMGDLNGEAAALQLMALDNVQIGFRDLPKRKVKQRIKKKLMQLLMESAQVKDEAGGNESSRAMDHKPEAADQRDSTPSDPNRAAEPTGTVADADSQPAANPIPQSIKGDLSMAEIKEILEKFKSVDGFQAVGVFSPQGELVAEVNTSGHKLSELGALANDVLLKAQKTTEIMGVGRGNMVHIQAPKAQIVTRCLNEATDFSATNSGRAHIHMVLVIEAEGSLAMGKMKMDAVIQELAPLFR